MFSDLPLLSLLIWLPIFGGLAVLAVGRGGNNLQAVRWLSLGVSGLTFLLSIPLFTGFDRTTWHMQFVERHAWVPVFDINYYLGVDGISMPLILLTAFATVLVVISAWEVIRYKASQYMAAFLIMEGLMIGVFCALDAILF
jgi:NADH-quinone oxidoreductase subunit M